MLISINQPAFFPWLGYFHRIAVSDLHIVLDHVQFEKNSFTNRNKIKTASGPNWITVPVQTSGKFGDLGINKIEISHLRPWKRKITESIRQFYRKSIYFDQYFPAIEDIVNKDWIKLNDLMIESNSYFLAAMGIKTPLVYSSQIEVAGTKHELVLNLCKKYNATTYLSGPLGKNYLDEGDFAKENIKVDYHQYVHPQYAQLYDGFQPNLSIVDLLFNHGPQSSVILMDNNERPI